jgi:hypothetical protein
MTIDGLSTVASVRAFLVAEVLPAVPRELAGELRAAVKLLATAETELDVRHASLSAETRDMIAHCAEAARLLGLQNAGAACERLAAARTDGATLTEVGRRWGEARELSSSILPALQRRESDPTATDTDRGAARELLRRFYACLTGHARARLGWQSVFPVPPDHSPPDRSPRPTSSSVPVEGTDR